QLKDAYPGSEITLLTMGLPRSAEMVRESLYRGGDKGVVLTDRPLGGADTLATSYSLAQAIKHMGKVDIIIGGRQAIDGDTAQVGPQIAEKLGLPQVTYAEKLTVADGVATIKRRVERGFETVQCPLPLVVTVNGSADACRPRNARLIQKYKYAVSPSEKANLSEKMQALVDARPYLNITEWGVKDIEADPEQIGLKGSPTKVKTVVNVVFQAKESKRMDGNNDAELEGLVKELIADHIIG
ncbi:MAG: electron transfer flavoprotein beta subunit/FixA family protein, partial [Muribaculaceae bacterium]|nr:electron transfer flavoprotein beta subunit/FixA family protein [Muribaculaceae bacterium]